MSGSASLDLRLPIGGLFTALGVIIGVYGLVTNGSAMYAQSESININLWWGLVMLVVGLVMFITGMRATRVAHPSGMHETLESPQGRATERRERESGLER